MENVLITEEVQLQQQTTGTRRQRESKKDLLFLGWMERNMFRPQSVACPLNKLPPGRHQARATGQVRYQLRFTSVPASRNLLLPLPPLPCLKVD